MPFQQSVHLCENISVAIFYEDLVDRPDQTTDLDKLLAHAHTSRKTLLAHSKAGRRIAGNKRVAKFRENQGYSGTGQVLQSITAWPALQYSSFEELRLECYLQTKIARGCKPDPVDPTATPWAVIPPVFNAYKDDSKDEDAGEVVMTD
ncbi:hypothetical protein CPB84DRAFT_1842075 [Gymnopilus junonius]|uniref:Uncharacterized protein n=1 Tax=Gymnopilus junonius TaxID=109634 RepID=A0A9P5NZL2_GYMJU|nr:hypothetical protein CPB84DRAFT_1842075 [Gymnopilus junonius]